jgi:hypothetical protein
MDEPLFAGQLGNWLAILGAVSCVYWAWRLLAALVRYAQASPTGGPGKPVATPAASRGTAPAALGQAALGIAGDLPFIAAAVAAIMGNGRVVHIEEVPHGQSWTAQGRWLHQTSHQPH